MITKILNNKDFFAICRNACEENGVRITFNEKLVLGDNFLILKLDEFHFYNSRDTHNPLPCIDNLIVVRCCDGSFVYHLVELRQSQGKHPTRRLRPNEILKKFQTVADDFFPKHSEIFVPDEAKSVHAYLVSDPWNISEKPEADSIFRSKAMGSCLDAYSGLKPINVLGQAVVIQPVLPPNPIINPC
jgi:hypothetical protein